VWSDWQYCLASNGTLGAAGWGLVVAQVIDAHSARLIEPRPPAALFKAGDAPEQYAVPIGHSKELQQIVRDLWANPSPTKTRRQQATLPFAKLMDKGKMNPRSVRYISPQITRCRTCPRSQRMTLSMLKAWLLGSYTHRSNAPPPHVRLQIISLDFEGMIQLVAEQPSKHLYSILAECIASVSMADPGLHILASMSNPDFAAYAETVFVNAAAVADHILAQLVSGVRTKARLKLLPVVFKTDTARAATVRPTITMARCSAVATAAQHAAARSTAGMESVDTFVCMSCSAVHVRASGTTRASKTKLGVSIDLCNPGNTTCNACGAAAARAPLTGWFIAGNIHGTFATATACAVCAKSVINPVVVGQLPTCKPCATIQKTLCCPCGLAAAYPALPRHAFVAIGAAGAQGWIACKQHAAAAAELKQACFASPRGAGITQAECLLFFSTHAQHCV
jgi:hypothetical protein